MPARDASFRSVKAFAAMLALARIGIDLVTTGM